MRRSKSWRQPAAVDFAKPPEYRSGMSFVAKRVLAALSRKRARKDLSAESGTVESLPVTIVVPVFNALAEANACIQSVLAHTQPAFELLLIDDRSTDPRVWPTLLALRDTHPQITVHRNPVNLGYTKSVNIGCRWARGDVVLLNSDARVTPRWLEKLKDAATSRERVATVTPLSNAAGAFSVPRNHVVNDVASVIDDPDMALLVERLSDCRRPETPTGNGFCMYITRAAIDSIGVFDEVRFPRGYGEENDFCVRATRASFVHLVDDTTYVHHERSASFGAEKEKLIAEGMATIRALYPDYSQSVRKWLENDGLGELRTVLAAALLHRTDRPQSSEKPTILYVVHAARGGTILTSNDLAGAATSDFNVLILRTGPREFALDRVEDQGQTRLLTVAFDDLWSFEEPLRGKRARTVASIVSDHRVRICHIRHTIANAPEIIDLLSLLGVPVIHSFHDFYALCPTAHLIDDRGEFCAGQCNGGEADCALSRKWFVSPPRLKGAYVHTWRHRYSDALRGCAALVTTTPSAHELLLRYYPHLAERDFRIIEHGRDLAEFSCARTDPAPGAPMRVLIFGTFGAYKGTPLADELVRIGRERGIALEFHVLGDRDDQEKLRGWGAITHGAYASAELPARLISIGPSVSIMPAVFWETYSHTLTESWAAGIPVLASSVGALADRIQRHGGGWLLPPSAGVDEWLVALLRIAQDLPDYRARCIEVDRIPRRTVRDMYSDYSALYDDVLRTRNVAHVQPVSLELAERA